MTLTCGMESITFELGVAGPFINLTLDGLDGVNRMIFFHKINSKYHLFIVPTFGVLSQLSSRSLPVCSLCRDLTDSFFSVISHLTSPL